MLNLKTNLRDAISILDESLQTAEEEQRRLLLKSQQEKTRKKVKKTLEGEPTLDEVVERIDRLILFQQIVRNIRMNQNAFKNSKLEFRPNQLNSIHKLIEFLQNEGMGGTTGYIKQPTGAGKTVLFGIIARLCDVETLILVPKTNLLTQTKKELVEVVGYPEEMIGLIGAGHDEFDKLVRIATYQSHRSLIARNRKYKSAVQSCKLVVCDEAHRALGKETQDSLEALDGEYDEQLTEEEQKAENDVLKNLGKYTSSRALKIGFTATPKLQNKHVEDAFKYMIAEEKHADLVKSGILVPYRIVHTDGTITEEDLEDGYLTQKKEIEILRRENSYKKLLGEYLGVLAQYKKAKKKHQYPLRGAAFCVKISECDRFSREAKALGLRCRVLTSRETKGMNADDADKLLYEAEQQLIDQEIDLLVTVTKLAEGWNFKPANAAIWARASHSPALIMQGVGRTARSYEDEKGRKKDFSYVFETDWHMREKTSRRVPLTIADAMSQMGENPKEYCEMADGSDLVVRSNVMLDENGIILFEGEECVGLRAYGEPFGVKGDTLQINVEKLEIIPVGNALSRRGQEVPVYRKAEIDSLECVQNAIAAGDKRVNERAEIEIDNILGVACPKYADIVGCSRGSLRDEIKDAKIKALGKARCGPTAVDIYPKSEIDKLKCVQNALATAGRSLNDDATIDINGVLGVGCPTYTAGLSKGFFIEKLAKNGPKPIGKARSGSLTVNVYVKEEIDKWVRRLKLQDDATVETDKGVAVGLTGYANILGIDHKKLHAIVNAKKLKPVGKALSGSHVPFVYLKCEVDALPELAEAIQKIGKKLDDRGIFSKDGYTAVGTKAYARYLGCYGIYLDNLIKAHEIKSIGKALSGSNEVDIYPKDEVDSIPELQEFLKIRKIPINENGIVDWDGILGICVNLYAKYRHVMHSTLKEVIDDAKIEPLGKIKSGTSTIDVYPKDEVDSLPLIDSFNYPVKDNGTVKFKGLNCVGIKKYVDFRGMRYSNLVYKIKAAGLEIIGFAKSSNKTVPLYLKSEVDKLINE